MGFFSPTKRESNKKIQQKVQEEDQEENSTNTEEFECSECGETYSTEQEADNCCVSFNALNKKYIIITPTHAFFDIGSFVDEMNDEFKTFSIMEELSKALEQIYSKGFKLVKGLNYWNDREDYLLFEKNEKGLN